MLSLHSPTGPHSCAYHIIDKKDVFVSETSNIFAMKVGGEIGSNLSWFPPNPLLVTWKPFRNALDKSDRKKFLIRKCLTFLDFLPVSIKTDLCKL